jgi:hypothetical protein
MVASGEQGRPYLQHARLSDDQRDGAGRVVAVRRVVYSKRASIPLRHDDGVFARVYVDSTISIVLLQKVRIDLARFHVDGAAGIRAPDSYD